MITHVRAANYIHSGEGSFMCERSLRIVHLKKNQPDVTAPNDAARAKLESLAARAPHIAVANEFKLNAAARRGR